MKKLLILMLVIALLAVTACNVPKWECNNDGVCDVGESELEGCNDCTDNTYDNVCEESDNGMDPDQRGVTKVYNEVSGKPIQTEEDTCRNSEFLNEAYCTGGEIKNELAIKTVQCEGSCVNGECVENNTLQSVCYDSDGGINEDVPGFVRITYIINNSTDYVNDTCQGNTLSEKYCINDGLGVKTIQCENTCEGRRCVEKSEPEDKGEAEIESAPLELNGDVLGGITKPEELLGLKEYVIDFSDNDLKYYDEISLTDVGLKTSLYEENFGDEVYMVIADGGLEYRVLFPKKIDLSEITEKNPLKINFLGEDLIITKATEWGIWYLAGNLITLEEKESATIDGYKVTLDAVGDNSVRVSVNGETKVISAGETESFESADDFEVHVVENGVFYVEGRKGNSADLRVGTDVEGYAQGGDPATLFGEPDSRSDAEWVWLVDFSDNNYQRVGLRYNQDRNELDDDFPAIRLGKSLYFPNDIFALTFKRLEEKNYRPMRITIDEDIDLAEEGDGESINSANGLHFEGLVFYVGDAKTSHVWVVDEDDSFAIWYKDGADEVKSTETNFKISATRENITVYPPQDPSTNVGTMNDENRAWKIDFGGVDKLWFYADTDKDFFGHYDDEEARELLYGTKYASSMAIGTRDYDFVTSYGVIIEKPEVQFGSGSSFDMLIPEGQQMGTVALQHVESVSSGGSSGGSGVPKEKITN